MDEGELAPLPVRGGQAAPGEIVARCRYLRAGLWRDWGAAWLGGMAGGIALVQVWPHGFGSALAASWLLLVAGFAMRVWNRQHLELLVEPCGLRRMGHAPMLLTWSGLARMRLRYFGPRSPRGWQSGTLELRLDGAGGKMIVDSTLEGFDTVLREAVAAANERGLVLDRVTLANMRALGLRLEGEAGGDPARSE